MNNAVTQKVIVLRGVSGCGKTYVAETIEALNPASVVVCCADDFFMKAGKYEFDVEKLGAAHAFCFRKFKEAIADKVELVVVANTNTAPRQFRNYSDYAKERGVPVMSLVVENRHGGKDSHDVPEGTLGAQEDKLKNSIQLR